MSKKKIRNILINNGGIIFSEELRKLNISTKYLTDMVEQGEICKYAPGIYITDDYFPDEMFLYQKRFSKLIYSHETSLYLLGLIDRNPLVYTITIPYYYPTKKFRDIGFEVFHSQKENYSLGLITHKNEFGNELKIYDVERSLCDLLRHIKTVDVQMLSTAFQDYVNGNTVKMNLPKLNQYAKKLDVTNPLVERLSILL